MSTKKALEQALNHAGRAARTFRRVNEILHDRASRLPKSPMQRRAVEFFYEGDIAGGGFELVANMLRVIAKEVGPGGITLVRQPGRPPDVRPVPRVNSEPIRLLDEWKLALWSNLDTLNRFNSKQNPDELLGQLR